MLQDVKHKILRCTVIRNFILKIQFTDPGKRKNVDKWCPKVI